MHPRNLHFKYTRVSAVNRIATRTFRDKKQQHRSRVEVEAEVYIGVDNREKVRARDEKNKGDQFCLKNNMKIL